MARAASRNPQRWCRAVVATVFAISLTAGSPALAGQLPAASEICPPGHFIVFVLGTASNGIGAEFDEIKNVLVSADPRCATQFRGYSYDGLYESTYSIDGTGNKQFFTALSDSPIGSPRVEGVDDPSFYRCGDTHTSDGVSPCSARLSTYTNTPDQSAARLQDLLSELAKESLTAHQEPSFDIVTFSLGGFVAAYWAALSLCDDVCHQRAAIGGNLSSPTLDLKRVRHIVAIDGPLAGRDLAFLASKFCDAIILKDASSDMARGCKGKIPEWLDPLSPASQIVALSHVEREIVLESVRSSQDEVVPAYLATLNPGVSGTPYWRDFEYEGGYQHGCVPNLFDFLATQPPGVVEGIVEQVTAACFLDSHFVFTPGSIATTLFLSNRFNTRNQTYSQADLRGDFAKSFVSKPPVCDGFFGCIWDAFVSAMRTVHLIPKL